MRPSCHVCRWPIPDDELVVDITGARHGSDRREIVLEGDSRDVVLADWLNELVYLADAEQFVPDALAELELHAGGLRANVRGHLGLPTPLVKAASLHGLEYGRAPGGGWQARVVLDV